MDMKKLIAQIDHIESKQILNEGFPTVADAQARADKEKTTDKNSNQKKAEKKNEDVEFQGSIAQMLLREFGLEEAAPVANPYQGADAAKFAAMSPADQAWLTKGGGVPDINDQFILARAPNKGAAVAPAAPAAPSGGAAQPATTMTAADQDDADMGAAMAANAAAAPAAAAPAAAAPTTGGDTGEVPGVTTQAGATPATSGGAAQPAKPAAPAAPAANKAMTPAVTAYASRLGLLKNNKPDVEAIKKFQQDNGLKADGIIGPNTAGAILSAQKPGMAGSGRGSQGGPTAAQLAQAPTPAGGGAAQPATGSVKPRYKTPQEFDKEIARFSKTSNPNLPPNARYIATLQAEKAALGGGAAQPASSALPGKAVSGGGQISNTPAAESMLQRIKSLAGL